MYVFVLRRDQFNLGRKLLFLPPTNMLVLSIDLRSYLSFITRRLKSGTSRIVFMEYIAVRNNFYLFPSNHTRPSNRRFVEFHGACTRTGIKRFVSTSHGKFRDYKILFVEKSGPCQWTFHCHCIIDIFLI